MNTTSIHTVIFGINGISTHDRHSMQFLLISIIAEYKMGKKVSFSNWFSHNDKIKNIILQNDKLWRTLYSLFAKDIKMCCKLNLQILTPGKGSEGGGMGLKDQKDEISRGLEGHGEVSVVIFWNFAIISVHSASHAEKDLPLILLLQLHQLPWAPFLSFL